MTILLRNAPIVAALTFVFNTSGVLEAATAVGDLFDKNFTVSVESSTNSVSALAIGSGLLEQSPSFRPVLEVVHTYLSRMLSISQLQKQLVLSLPYPSSPLSDGVGNNSCRSAERVCAMKLRVLLVLA